MARITWREFTNIVYDLLPVDVARRNVGQLPAGRSGLSYVERQIRQAVLDLQHHIRYYREGHQTTYLYSDLIESGDASLGTLPINARLSRAKCVSIVDPEHQRPYTPYPWEHRDDLMYSGGAVLR